MLSIFPGELIQGIFAINSRPRGTFSGEYSGSAGRCSPTGLSGTRLENGGASLTSCNPRLCTGFCPADESKREENGKEGHQGSRGWLASLDWSASRMEGVVESSRLYRSLEVGKFAARRHSGEPESLSVVNVSSSSFNPWEDSWALVLNCLAIFPSRERLVLGSRLLDEVDGCSSWNILRFQTENDRIVELELGQK